MSERWLGIVVSGDKITLIDAEVPKEGPLVLQSDQTFPLQAGDRSVAYAVMYQRVRDYVSGQKIARVVIKASALSQGAARLAHLTTAELRGVVMAAAASPGGKVSCLAKALISRTFGSRKVDEYISDEGFWETNIAGSMRVGSREAAMILLAARGK